MNAFLQSSQVRTGHVSSRLKQALELFHFYSLNIQNACISADVRQYKHNNRCIHSGAIEA